MNPKQSALNTELGLTQALEFGYSFVEKFIQLSFRVPQPSIRSIRSFLASLGPQDQKKETGETSTEVNFNPVLLVAEGQDSEEFKTIIEACAPFFDYNPRRLKQFINTFRLKAHICHSTGLFNAPEPGFEALTIPRLGKFVAIILKWPQITEDLIENPDLFEVITNDSKLVEGSKAYSWKQNASFMKLLELSPASQELQVFSHPEALAATKRKFALTGIDVLALLRTSPSVSHARLASPQQPEDFTGSQYYASPWREGNLPEAVPGASPSQAKRRKASVKAARR